MLSNATILPPKPINDGAEAGAIVYPSLVALEGEAKRREVLASPDGTEDIPGRVEAILGSRIVVLEVEPQH